MTTVDFWGDAEKFPEFSRGDIEAFITAFTDYDKDNSGSIDAKELAVALKSIGQGCSPEQLNQLIAAVDEDNSGEIEWPEFLKLMGILYPHKRQLFEMEFLVPAHSFPEFTQQEHREFIDTFREFDEDGSGSINIHELGKLFRYMGQGSSPEQLDRIIEEADEDGSGDIDFEEFLGIMSHFCYPHKRAHFEHEYYEPAKEFIEFCREEIDIFVQTFREFDFDGSGTIDTNELAQMLRAMGQGSSPQQVEALLSLVDDDKSGDIDWREFLVLMKHLYPGKAAEVREEFFAAAADFPHFSRSDVKIFVQAFKEFDADGSGAIDASELSQLLKSMGIGATSEQVKEILDAVDADDTGDLDFSEFLQVMTILFPIKKVLFRVEFLEPAAAFPEFTRQEILAFVVTFREFDEDDSGSIDINELEKMFQFMGQGFDRKTLEKIIKEEDADGSGEIEFDEFLAIMSKYCYPNRKAHFVREFYESAKEFYEFNREDIDVFVQAFRAFDLDGSGNIDAGELQVMLLSMGESASPQKVMELMALVDSNGSGLIEWSEFLQIMRLKSPFKMVECEIEYFLPAMLYPEFTRQDVITFIQSFKEFDADGSGTIDAAELTNLFKSMGLSSTPDKIKNFIQQVNDGDDSAEIEWLGFLKGMSLLYPFKKDTLEKDFYEAAQKFKEFDRDDITVFIIAFRRFDVDGSESIDADELTEILKFMGQGCSTQQAKEFVTKYDADKSGEIEFVEFLQIMSDLYHGKSLHSGTPSAAAPQKTAAAPQKATAPAPQKVAAAPQKTVAAAPQKTVAAPSPQKTAAAPVKAATPNAARPLPTKNSAPANFTGASAASSNPKAFQSYLAVGQKTVPLASTDQHINERKEQEAAEKSALEKRSWETQKPEFQNFGIDSDLQQRMQGKYDPELENQLKQWISEVTGEAFPDGSFADALKSGVVMCNLANKIKAGSVKKVNKMKTPFMQMENINNFLVAAKDLGVPASDLFQTVDLYEEKNMNQVLQTFLSLGRVSQTVPGYSGPTIGVKMSTKHEVQFTEEQLKKGQTELTLAQRSQADSQGLASSARRQGHNIIK